MKVGDTQKPDSEHFCMSPLSLEIQNISQSSARQIDISISIFKCNIVSNLIEVVTFGFYRIVIDFAASKQHLLGNEIGDDSIASI